MSGRWNYIDFGTERVHGADKRSIARAPGLHGVTGVRQITRNRPNRHGNIDDTKHSTGKVATFEGEVWGDDAADSEAEFGAIAAELWGSLDSPITVKWQRGDSGLLLQSRDNVVKLAGPLAPPLEHHSWLLYQAHLNFEDPRAYSQTETTDVGSALSVASGGKIYPYTYPRGYNPSSGGSASVNNGGIIPTPPIFKVYGYCTSPAVRLQSTSEEISLNGEISDGDFMEIDVYNRTIKLNGTVNKANLLDSVGTTWFSLPPGADTVQLLAPNFNASARVDVIYRDAYL